MDKVTKFAIIGGIILTILVFKFLVKPASEKICESVYIHICDGDNVQCREEYVGEVCK